MGNNFFVTMYSTVYAQVLEVTALVLVVLSIRILIPFRVQGLLLYSLITLVRIRPSIFVHNTVRIYNSDHICLDFNETIRYHLKVIGNFIVGYRTD